MGLKKNLSGLLAADILAMAVIYLIPDGMGDWQVPWQRGCVEL